MVTTPDAKYIELLGSSRPSERATAAHWFLHNAKTEHERALTSAIANESVPALRRQLILAKRSIDAGANPSAGDEGLPAERDTRSAIILDELSGLLRHETEPIIGWLRRAAADELGSRFETSQTFANIELLRQRIRGLETLTAAHKRIRLTRESLGQLVRACKPPAFEGDFPQAAVDDDIETDEGLFNLIVGNALLNAHEAARATSEGDVLVESGVTAAYFWLSITNHFEGQGFTLDEVARSGTSSKQSHKGLGVGAMQLAADRLGYSISLRAAGGTAHFHLRGARVIGEV